MLKNFFKVAIRNLWKHKSFSLLSIAGLALGLTCSLLIMLWVQDEYRIDNFHTNGNRLYVLYERQYIDQKIQAGYYTPALLAYELKKKIPEVEYATACITGKSIALEAGNKIIKHNGGWADSDFFKMFSYPLLEGNVATALNTAECIAISNKMAQQIYGSASEAMGKPVRLGNEKTFIISAVFADLPENVYQKFDFLINWAALLQKYEWLKDWRNNSPQTYIMLRADANPIRVEKKIKKFLTDYNKSFTSGFRIELYMQRFRDIYLHSNFVNGVIEGGRVEYVRLFSLVAIFILLIACINFMNLTTARSARRAKEIGMRKVSGAVRGALMGQFLSEAIFVTILSMILSLLLVNLSLPLFSQLTNKHIQFPFSSYVFWISLICLTIFTGFISGSYPALFLSSFKPIEVLKGTLKFSKSTILLRKGLVVFQFVLSVVLIIGTIVVSKQINYVQSVNLGYDRENLLYIPLEGNLSKQYSALKQQALNTPGIKSVSCISDAPTYISNGTSNVEWDGKDANTTPLFTTTAAGYDFVKTMDLKLLKGRDFSREFISDSSGYLVNEEALKIINYKDPIGKPLTLWGQKGVIIGVLKDFHFASLHDPIKPMIVHLGEKDGGSTILVRTETGRTKQAVASLEKICKTLNPKFPFSYQFSDDEYQKLYKNEEIVSKLSNYFAALAIFISCMGLLGLAMFTTEQRTKEIGIRKVLGASVTSLFALLSGEFIRLVMIALIIAFPLAWWSMNIWLLDFAYRISISWWMFLVAGVLAVLIVLLTISFQAIKSAIANPIKSLRTE